MNQEPLKIHYIKFGQAKIKRKMPDELLDPVGSLHTACLIANIAVKEAVGPSKRRTCAYRRFEVMSLLAGWGFTSQQIGGLLGGRDHTTVLHGINRWEDMKLAAA
jgi:chromosomal replication initiation ATPase DnaA